MSRTPWRSGPRPPLLGEHTTEVLTDVGIGENLADLRREGVL
jgi:crotonobetainyl-CoA:carnitine CoA-transferase CaiB-like acyl-CoA transferase